MENKDSPSPISTELLSPDSIEPSMSEDLLNMDKNKGPDKEQIREMWEETGLHKVIGGFFYNFVYMALAAVLSVALFTFILQILIPFPTSKGYYDVSKEWFMLVFKIFDVGTGFAIERFIAEWRIKNKAKMMKYIQFYIWYQMWTGLVQIVILSVYILNFNQQMSYLNWVMLIIITTQYPGMLGTFRSVIKGLQHYQKVSILDFLSDQGFQMATQIIFFIAGRYWGMAHPAIGEMLGLAIGMVLGYWIDDFFSMFLAGYLLNKIVKPYGFSFRDCWRHDFGWDIVKECMIFGIGVTWQPIVSTALGFITLNIALSSIPAYTTWKTLAEFGAGLGSAINMGNINIQSPMSEAINNDKYHLGQYYLAQVFKYWGFLAFSFSALIAVVVTPLLEVIQEVPSIADQYANIGPFIIPGMVNILLIFPNDQFSRILASAGKVWYLSGIGFIADVMNIGVFYWMVNVGEIYRWGITGIIFLFIFRQTPANLFKAISYGMFVNRKIFKIRISWWQTFGASLCSFGAVYVIGWLFVNLFYLPLIPLIGAIPATIIAVLIILVGFLVFFFPFFYGIFGGWDTEGLLVFRKAMDISGPSKFFVRIMYKMSYWGSMKSPMYNRWVIDFSEAKQELADLEVIRKQTYQNSDQA